MKKDQNHDYFVKKVLANVQFLDELGGPDTSEGYVLILKDVILELERRIDTAKTNPDYNPE
jgi:hypothetical protein